MFILLLGLFEGHLAIKRPPRSRLRRSAGGAPL